MKLTHLTPVLNVSDVPASLVWFEELGWERDPTDESWSMREFHLRHPDGHTFRVSCESG